jgi:hypothetical protein
MREADRVRRENEFAKLIGRTKKESQSMVFVCVHISLAVLSIVSNFGFRLYIDVCIGKRWNS